jgi:FtsP/CotA-like multicopper oxidase with cupredoxin domain
MAIETKSTTFSPDKHEEEVQEENLSKETRTYLDTLNSHTTGLTPPLPPGKRPVAIGRPWWRSITSPLAVLFIAVAVLLALVSFGMGASINAPAVSSSNNSASSSSSSSSSSMDSQSGTQTTPSNVPNATQNYGNQLAKYTIDPDGAKHFTLTAYQVMWQPVKGGQRVLAWSINGTVPGPMIRVTAGDHVRVTFINHFPAATAVHWHGLEVPSDQDGVPGVGQKPIQPGQTYVYDFYVHDSDVGTHWYHSHYNDMVQVPGGFYGAFIVDPRPGTPAAKAFAADVDYTMIISEMGPYYVINGKSFPDTQPIIVKHGQTVHIRLIGAGEMIHPMHLHGHLFYLFAQSSGLLAQPIPMDTIEVAPGGTYDIRFTAWAAPGSIYPFHCHILSHLMNPGQSEGEMGGLIVLVEYAK